MRSEARECAFKLIFAYTFTGAFDEDLKKAVYSSNKLDVKGIEYSERIIEGVVNNLEALKAIISEFSVGFDLNRIFKADFAILLVAALELCYFEDIPPIVSIDEAVNLAKKYSAENSISFVNGVLAGINSKVKK